MAGAGYGAARRVARLRTEPSLRPAPWLVAPLSPAATVGLAAAMGRGSNRTMSQTRSAIRAACFGRLGVVAAAIFGASLDHLQETPRLYGAVATALLLANLIAAIPARAAGRTHGADILRTE